MGHARLQSTLMPRNTGSAFKPVCLMCMGTGSVRCGAVLFLRRGRPLMKRVVLSSATRLELRCAQVRRV